MSGKTSSSSSEASSCGSSMGDSDSPRVMPRKSQTKKVSLHQIALCSHSGNKLIGGRYLIGEKIGEGSYGVVKEVLDTKTGKKHALKIVTSKKLRNIPGGEETILREIQNMQRIKSKYCTQFVDYWKDEEQEKIYFVLEFMGGGSLRELLERSASKKLPFKQARRIFRQLIRALDYIHSIGLVHRDVKPDNLMLTNNGTAKLSDFGVACTLRDGENENMERMESNRSSSGSETSSQGGIHRIQHQHGSPAFHPPEVANGLSNFSGSAMDIWAAGIVLYEMVVGSYPFKTGNNVRTLLENIIECKYELPDDLDSSLSSLLRGLLEKDPQKRMSTLQIKVHPWMLKRIKREEFIPLAQTPSVFKGETKEAEASSSSCIIS